MGLTSLLVFLTVAAPPAEGYRYPPRTLGETTVELTVHVHENNAPGMARVSVTLDIRGPADLEVEPPILEDALAGWKVQRAASGWTLADNHSQTTWDYELTQIKPGLVPLPGVRLRLGSGPEGWQELTWPALLQGSLSPPPPEVPPNPPTPSWVRWLLLSGSVLAVLIVLVGGWLVWRTRRPRVSPLPHQDILAQLERLSTMPIGSAQEFHASLAHLLRTFLGQHLGLDAQRLLTCELLVQLAQQPTLDSSHLEPLRTVLEACDQVKYAGLAPSKEECLLRAQQTRALVLTLSKKGKNRQEEADREKSEMKQSS